MEQIIHNLFLGSEKSHDDAVAKGYSILACDKDGTFGHRQWGKYDTRAAPKGPDYYYIRRGNEMRLNLIDPDTPALIAAEAINAGLGFIKEQQEKDKPLLVHCVQGKSRSPSIILMYLRTIGEMPNGFLQSEKKFKTIYPLYDPMQGIKTFMQANWRNLLWKGSTENVHERYSKGDVKYEDVAKGKDKCSGCINFVESNGCEIVVGLIQPLGSCNKWEAKSDAKG